jgi:hypothetical protein
MIGADAFSNCRSLKEVIFPADSCLKMILGFQYCFQLFRIEIPASVETIEHPAFTNCHSLRTVIFRAGSRLKILSGFRFCSQLFRIEIPASVEVMNPLAFSHCYSLRSTVFAPNSCLRKMHGFGNCGSLSRIEIPSDSPIASLHFFVTHPECLVLREMSEEWSILFEKCSSCHMIDEPLTDMAEIPESGIVKVNNESMKISKISDRLFCLSVSRFL